ncbi:hypothetical protein OT109_12965 [Phycisphaeraceae bacterium D3-23]
MLPTTPTPTRRRHKTRTRWRLAAPLVALALLLVPTARADDAANPLDRNGPGGNPAQQAAAPEWVVPGARITDAFMFASGPKEVRPNQAPGTAGTGFTQYDIVAVTPDGVVIQARSYMAYEPGRPVELSGTHIALTDHATGGGLWMQPTVIAATQPTDSDPNATITKEPIEINGETYEAIHFVNKSGNTTIRRVYDIRTGIRLAESNLTEDAQNRNHESAQYAGYRVAQLPWIGTEFTEQIQGLNKLIYEGAMVFVSPPTPGIERMPDMEMDFEAEFAFAVASPQLIAVNLTFDIDMPEGPNQTNERQEPICPGQRMGLYIHPDVLIRLEDGQVLDEDPTIGYRIVVTDVYQVQGVTLVEITEQGRGNSYHNKATYDASVGLQVAAEWTQPAMSQRIESQLERVE